MSQFSINISKCSSVLCNLDEAKAQLKGIETQIDDALTSVSQLENYHAVTLALAKIKKEVYIETTTVNQLHSVLKKTINYYQKSDQIEGDFVTLINLKNVSASQTQEKETSDDIENILEILLQGIEKLKLYIESLIINSSNNDETKTNSSTSEHIEINPNPENTNQTTKEMEKNSIPESLHKYYDNNSLLISKISETNTNNCFSYDINNIKNIYNDNKDIYDKISAETNIPPELIAALHYRESNCNFDTYLHNGDPLGIPTTHEPTGILFDNFTEAAIDALNREQKEKGIYLTSDSSMTMMMTFAEIYNGTGYTNYHDIASPYVYSGTNVYESGKYTSDGEFNAEVVDKQPGIYLLIKSLMNE